MSTINIDKREVIRTNRNNRVNTSSSATSVLNSFGGGSSSGGNSYYPEYNVKKYGAVGDGVKDDTVALQTTIYLCHAAGGGVVKIPAGNYKISTGLKGFSNIIIRGEGRDTTKISTANFGYGGATFGDGSANSSVMLYFEDSDNVVIEDLHLIGVGIDGSSCQGIEFALVDESNTAHIIMNNLLVTDMCSGAGITINTPILTTITNVKVLRIAGSCFYMYDGTSVTMNECYAITATEAGFLFDTMTYCVFNSCASEVTGVAFDFKSCSAIVLNGCGTEGILNRNESHQKYSYGTGLGTFKPAFNGVAYRSVSSNIQLNSCYSRDPATAHTEGEMTKINCREFTLVPMGVTVTYNSTIRQSYAGQSTLALAISNTATIFNLATGTGANFPTSDFYVSIYPNTYTTAYQAYNTETSYGGYQEIIYVSTRVGDVCFCPIRGTYPYNNKCIPLAFASGSKIDCVTPYKYAITFFDAAGNETGLSEYAGRGYYGFSEIALNNIVTSSDPLVVGRNIYRTSVYDGIDSEIFYKIHTISDNITTNWVDNVPDIVANNIVIPAPEPTMHKYSTVSGSSDITVQNNRFMVGDVVKVTYSDYMPYPFSRAARYKYVVRYSSGNVIRISKEEDLTNSLVTFGTTTTATDLYMYKYDMPGEDLGVENNIVSTFKNTTKFINGLKSNIVYFGSGQNSVALSTNLFVTGNYTQTLQNKSGTVALLSDISASGGGSGTVTEINTSGAITGGTITSTGTIGHSTEDGFLHVPATNTTNDRKVLTAGATAGAIAWESLPAIPTSTDITKWNDTATALNVSNLTNRFLPVYDGTKFINSTIYDTGNILIGGTVDDGGKLQVTGKIKTTGGLSSDNLIYTSHYNQGIASFRGNWAGSNYWGIGTKNGATDTISIESTDRNGVWVGGNVNLAITGSITSTGDLTAKNYNLTSSFTDNLSFNGTYESATVGESVVFGDVLYLKFSDGKWWKAKADSFATTPVQRIAVETIAANATGKLLIEGFLRNDSWTFSNANVYLSAATAGLITTTAPATTGNQIQKIGVAFSATKLHFKPSIDIGEI